MAWNGNEFEIGTTARGTVRERVLADDDTPKAVERAYNEVLKRFAKMAKRAKTDAVSYRVVA
jgi:hypothetical protein